MLSKEQAIKKHRELWRWIAKQTKKQQRIVTKDEYFKAKRIKEKNIPYNHCYCCEYALDKNDQVERHMCKYCPLDWGQNQYCGDSYYADWTYLIIRGDDSDWREAVDRAHIIAELPEKEEF